MLDFPFPLRNALERYTRDLTAAAMRDELDPVCSRERETERVITILVRQSKNNPVLIGEAGVGKTAVVEGLARRIGEGSVPDALKTARILAVSHMDLIAGTSFRGQYEKRIQAVVNEASANREVILFIDELHNLIGAGTAIGVTMDAANMLKPALASGQLRVIGATTEFEYDRYVRADSALERRFQPVRIEELSREQTLEVLRARRPRLQMHHLLTISDDAIEAAVDQSVHFVPDRKQPDRSIDLLDETCASIRLANRVRLSNETVRLQRQREELLTAERTAVRLILDAANGRGTPVERFSRGTYKAFESIGLRLERLITGQTSLRRPLPPPDSVTKRLGRHPEKQLAKLHLQRLRVENQLQKALRKHSPVVGAEDILKTVTAGKI